jgi:membrane protease YdiL (CAAX protease family)
MDTESIDATPPAVAGTPPQPVPGWVLIVAPLLGTILFVLLLGVAVAVAAFSGNLGLGGGVRDIVAKIQGNYFVVMGVGVLFYLTILFSTWLLLPKSGPASLASYFPSVSGRFLVAGAGAAIVIVLIILPSLGFISDYFHVNLEASDAEKALLPHSLPQLLALLILGAVAAPLVEEVYFRGVFLRWLRKRLGLAAATIINVVSFAVLHGRFLSHPGLAGLVATVGLCVPALVLVYFAVKSRSLWPGVVTHGVYNGVLLSLSYFVPNMS